MTAELSQLTSLGVGGIMVWLFIKEMFSFLKSRKNGDHDSKEIVELRAISKTLEALTENIQENTKVLQGIHEEMKINGIHVSEIKSKVQFCPVRLQRER